MLAPTVFLLALASSVVAQTSIKRNTVCTTKFGRTSRANVPTVTSTLPSTRQQKVVKTSTITRTSTPSGANRLTTVSTTTVTSPAVTTTEQTDIVTLITTSTSTSTEFTTTTVTNTKTTTTTETAQSTTTKAAPAGFTAIAQQSDYVQKRAEGHYRYIRQASSSKKLLFPAATGGSAAGMNPTAVTCGVTVTRVSTSTRTITTTSTLRATGPTTPVTSTRTITVTSGTSTVFLAPTTTTETSFAETSTTSTSTRSTTTTEAATATVTVAAFTFYAQCSDNNIISNVHSGIPIQRLTYGSSVSVQAETLDGESDNGEGYDCCAICAMTTQCAGYGLNPDGTCYTLRTNGNTCDGSMTFGDAYNYYGDVDSPDFYTVGNGQCGRLAAQPGPAGGV